MAHEQGRVKTGVTDPGEALQMNAKDGGHVCDELALCGGCVRLARAAEPPETRSSR